MSLDPTTESIAHFIGLFHLAEEEARLRKDYNEFKMEAKDFKAASFDFEPVRVKSSYQAGDGPHSRTKLKSQPLPPGQETVLPPSGDLSGPQLGGGGDFSEFVPFVNGGSGSASIGNIGKMVFLPYVPIPSSAVTITFQSIFLADNDIIGDVEAAEFASLEGFQAALNEGIELATALQPWSTESFAAEFLSEPSAAVEFVEVINSVTVPDIEGVTVSVASDEDVVGIHVNGEVVDEVPEFEDQLPEFIRAKRDKQNDEEEDQLAGDAKDKALHDRDNDEYATVINSEHNVSAGANETHNQVDIHTSWIDAGVIAVSGDVINLNAISQINILSDRDQYNGQEWSGVDATSKAQNIAVLEQNSREIPEATQHKAEGLTDLPETWDIKHIDGDVMVTNYVKQHTFATDQDRLDLTFTANSTSIVSGENLTSNYAHAGEFGFGYDLIFVGGTMLSLNAINQTNVLFDDDHFSGEGLGAAAISGNDNALRNEAQIHKEGVDTQVEMLKDFKDALHDLKKGAKELAKAVTQSELFEGLEQLHVLFIEGNLTQMNIVDQINYLGDQDQIHMALEAVVSALDDVPVAITTGSNLMTNTASILETGFDSNVMTDGEYYSDALLYQAELIDTDANPLGVGMSALASQAVAFLVDEMIPDSVSEETGSQGFDNDAHTGGSGLDIMQTMTA